MVRYEGENKKKDNIIVNADMTIYRLREVVSKKSGINVNNMAISFAGR